MAAPNSAQTIPSHKATIAPRIQPNSAIGPFALLSRRGIVINGPTPIISNMLAAVAWRNPMPRISCGSVESGKVIGYDTTCLRTAVALILLASVTWAQAELQQALTLTRAGRFREARDLIKGVPAPSSTPQQVAYHRLKAAIASGLQDNNTAAQEMEAALALSPEDQSLRLAAAVAEDRARRPDQAITLLSKTQDSADAKG